LNKTIRVFQLLQYKLCNFKYVCYYCISCSGATTFKLCGMFSATKWAVHAGKQDIDNRFLLKNGTEEYF